MILNTDQQLMMASLRGLAEMGIEACSKDWQEDNADLSADEMAAVMLANTPEQFNELPASAAISLMTVLTVMLVEERRERGVL